MALEGFTLNSPIDSGTDTSTSTALPGFTLNAPVDNSGATSGDAPSVSTAIQNISSKIGGAISNFTIPDIFSSSSQSQNTPKSALPGFTLNAPTQDTPTVSEAVDNVGSKISSQTTQPEDWMGKIGDFFSNLKTNNPYVSPGDNTQAVNTTLHPEAALVAPLLSSNLTPDQITSQSNDLNTRMDSLNAEGKSVDTTDPEAVNNYNAKLNQIKTDLSTFNNGVDQYNQAQKALSVISTSSGEESLGPSQEHQLEGSVNTLLLAGGLLTGATEGLVALESGAKLVPMLTKAVTQGVVGVGTFYALDKATAGLKENASDQGKLLIYLGELFASGGLLHTLNEAVPTIGDKIFQTYSEKYNTPKTIYFDGSKIPQKIATVPDSPEHQALVDALSTDGKVDKAKIKDAMKNGVTIEVPVSTIKNVAENPIWTKVKNAFGVESGAGSKTEVSGQGKKAPQEHNLLEGPTKEDIQAVAEQVKQRSEATKASESTKPQTVLVARHGDNILDEKGITAGQDQPGLTENGKKQVVDGAIKDWKGKGIQNVVTSDASRSTQSADLIGKAIGAKVVTDPRLATWDIGNLAGGKDSEVKPVLKDYANNKPDEKLPGGESFNQFRTRFKEGYLANAGPKNAFVLHGDGEKLLRSDFGNNMGEYNKDGIEHGQTAEIKVGGTKDKPTSKKSLQVEPKDEDGKLKLKEKPFKPTSEQSELQAELIATAHDMANGKISDTDGKKRIGEISQKIYDSLTPEQKTDFDAKGEKIKGDEEITFDKTVKEIQQGFTKIFGKELPLEVVFDAERDLKNPRALGRASKNLIRLLEENGNLSQAVANHEGWHWFKQQLSTEDLRIVNDIEKRYALANPDKIQALIDTGYTEKEAPEELMADTFAEYHKTGEGPKNQSWFDKIKSYWDRAIKALKSLFSKKDEVIDMFTKVQDMLKNNKGKADFFTDIKPDEKQFLKESEVPKDLEPLAEEAKKYSSVEEFVESQGVPIYHGTPNNFRKFNNNKSYTNSTWFSDSKEAVTGNSVEATRPPNSKWNVIERFIKPNIKLLDTTTKEGAKMHDDLMTGQLKDMGYRGVKYSPDTKRGQYIELFNPNEDTVTRSELTDIYNKAHTEDTSKLKLRKETQSIEQLQQQRERYEKSLEAFNENPELHIQAYGEDRSQIYKDKIAELTQRIKDLKTPPDDLTKIPGVRKGVETKSTEVKKEPTPEVRAKSVTEVIKEQQPKASKIRVSGKDIELPEEMFGRQFTLALKRENFVNNPAKNLAPYVAKSGEWKGELPEVTGKISKNVSRIKSEPVLKWINFGDSIADELGFKDSDEARDAWKDYVKEKQDLKLETKTLNQEINNYINKERDRIALERLASKTDQEIEKEQTKEEKLATKAKELDSVRNWKSLISEYAHEYSLPASLDEVEPPKVRGGIQAPQLNFSQWHDENMLRVNRETFERNIENVAPHEDALAIKKFLIDPVRQNETNRIKFNNKLRTQTQEKLKEFGIKRNSTNDELIQKYGEGMISDDDLKKASPDKWQQIEEAANYYRDQYDKLINHWNDVRKQFGYPEIPKRKDYFRHFDEVNFITKNYGLVNSKDQLPTAIAGKTEFFKPGKPFSTAELSRTGNQTKYSAIGGFDNYIDTVSKQIFHIDSIQRGRALERYMEVSAKNGDRLGTPLRFPNVISNFREYVNNGLAGKKASLDRVLESQLGRPSIKAFESLSKLIGKNIIVGNISTALSHLVTLPLITATTDPLPLGKGLITTLTSPLKSEPFNVIDGQESAFLTRRYPIEHTFRTMPQKAEDALSYLFKATDQFKSRLAVSSKYYEGIGKGLSPEEAMKQADTYAGKVVGDYSLGQRPNLMNAQTMSILAQFQLGLNDSLSVLFHDIPEDAKTYSQNKDGVYEADTNKWKIVKAFGTFIIFSYLFNLMLKQIRGAGKGLDPIDWFRTLTGTNQEGTGQSIPSRIGLTGKDIAGELPFISMFTGNFPLATAFSAPVAKFKAGDWKTGAEDLLAEFASPIGGGAQAKKTIEGVQAIRKGESTGVAQNVKSVIFGAGTAVTPNSIVTQKLNKDLKAAQTRVSNNPPSLVSSVQDVYDQVAKVGFGTPEGDAIVANLSDTEYKVYNQMKSVAKVQDAIDLESKILPIVQQVGKLGIGSPEADKLVNDTFPDTPEGNKGYDAYVKIKTAMYGAGATGVQVGPNVKAPKGAAGNNNNGTASFEGHPTYYKGQSGPDISKILGGNSDDGSVKGKTANGEPIYARDVKLETSRRREMYNADPYWKASGYKLSDVQFDHIVPLEAGGTNTANNVQLITKSADEGNQPFEDYLGKMYKDGKISRADAAKASIDYKINKSVSFTDVQKGKY